MIYQNIIYDLLFWIIIFFVLQHVNTAQKSMNPGDKPAMAGLCSNIEQKRDTKRQLNHHIHVKMKDFQSPPNSNAADELEIYLSLYSPKTLSYVSERVLINKVMIPISFNFQSLRSSFFNRWSSCIRSLFRSIRMEWNDSAALHLQRWNQVCTDAEVNGAPHRSSKSAFIRTLDPATSVWAKTKYYRDCVIKQKLDYIPDKF